MTEEETLDLLTLMASYDRRKVGKADVKAWHAIAGDLRFTDGWQAVLGHYAESTEWMMPAHLRQRVAAIRQARLDAAGPTEIPQELADRPIEAREWLQRTRDAIADGAGPQRAIASGGAP